MWLLGLVWMWVVLVVCIVLVSCVGIGVVCCGLGGVLFLIFVCWV